MGGEVTNELLQMLGEIRGELKGINASIERNHQATNQRLDDIQNSNEKQFELLNKRVDAVEKRVEHVEVEQKNMIWKISGWSALGGALVAAAIELIKR